eukprot:TRINITY_DN4783_c0_g1_i4.p1 TRINITY_DN4783_c0_g1~~TRINITY_DN4783_c0_g1_i4.p1  ORF type:complete len:707 (+),score=181.37 TRINITY_DN4783_c0_g1_i4:165-2285(+)
MNTTNSSPFKCSVMRREREEKEERRRRKKEEEEEERSGFSLEEDLEWIKKKEWEWNGLLKKASYWMERKQSCEFLKDWIQDQFDSISTQWDESHKWLYEDLGSPNWEDILSFVLIQMAEWQSDQKHFQNSLQMEKRNKFWRTVLFYNQYIHLSSSLLVPPQGIISPMYFSMMINELRTFDRLSLKCLEKLLEFFPKSIISRRNLLENQKRNLEKLESELISKFASPSFSVSDRRKGLHSKSALPLLSSLPLSPSKSKEKSFFVPSQDRIVSIPPESPPTIDVRELMTKETTKKILQSSTPLSNSKAENSFSIPAPFSKKDEPKLSPTHAEQIDPKSLEKKNTSQTTTPCSLPNKMDWNTLASSPSPFAARTQLPANGTDNYLGSFFGFQSNNTSPFATTASLNAEKPVVGETYPASPFAFGIPLSQNVQEPVISKQGPVFDKSLESIQESQYNGESDEEYEQEEGEEEYYQDEENEGEEDDEGEEYEEYEEYEEEEYEEQPTEKAEITPFFFDGSSISAPKTEASDFKSSWMNAPSVTNTFLAPPTTFSLKPQEVSLPIKFNFDSAPPPVSSSTFSFKPAPFSLGFSNENNENIEEDQKINNLPKKEKEINSSTIESTNTIQKPLEDITLEKEKGNSFSSFGPKPNEPKTSTPQGFTLNKNEEELDKKESPKIDNSEHEKEGFISTDVVPSPFMLTPSLFNFSPSL